MFDIGFSELVVLAVVALVVIGPERLPTVARTVGALLGRLNRYVADVKSDVEREMRLEEMKKLRAEVEQQAMGIEQSVVRELEETRIAVEQPVAEVQQSLVAGMVEVEPAGSPASQKQPDALPESDSPALPQGESVPLQKKPDNATAAVSEAVQPPSASRPASPLASPQTRLDFDAFNDPAPATSSPARPDSDAQPASKA